MVNSVYLMTFEHKQYRRLIAAIKRNTGASHPQATKAIGRFLARPINLKTGKTAAIVGVAPGRTRRFRKTFLAQRF